MPPADLVDILVARGLIRSPAAKITALAGGVSCDIFLIEDGDNRFVLKRALPKLRVKDDWYADVNRNRHEQDYIDYVSAFLPEAMPKILHRAPEHGFFTMEYLGGEFQNWKTMLLAGTHEPDHAERAGEILGTIHKMSWNEPTAKARFDTGRNFYDLRIEPYLITTGKRHPELRDRFESEASRLASTNMCLVHGDFSPKNILISPSRMVALDCEVAWFGDPAFDVAFLLNHLLLKMLKFRHIHEWYGGYLLTMVVVFWATYSSQIPDEEAVSRRTAMLLPMLMLARVDGKSPVEYLSAEDRECVRRFAAAQIKEPPIHVVDVAQRWVAMLAGE